MAPHEGMEDEEEEGYHQQMYDDDPGRDPHGQDDDY